MGHDELSIRPMQAGDIPAILALEAAAPSAWNRKQLEDELKQATGFQFVGCNAVSGKILAFLCGRIMADEAEILKLNVAADMRRKGLGRQLLACALDYCRTKGVKNCFLELRASNTAAGKLYEKLGFLRVGLRKAYYNDPVEDAVLLQREL